MPGLIYKDHPGGLHQDATQRHGGGGREELCLGTAKAGGFFNGFWVGDNSIGLLVHHVFFSQKGFFEPPNCSQKHGFLGHQRFAEALRTAVPFGTNRRPVGLAVSSARCWAHRPITPRM